MAKSYGCDRKRLRIAVTAGLLFSQCLLHVLSVEAQVVTGTLLGTVRDSSGSVVPNAQVVAILMERDLRRSTQTNNAGEYELGFLPIGLYTVSASYPGFTSQVHESVALGLDQRLRLDFVLQVGGVDSATTVTADTPLLKSDSSDIAAVISQERVQQLPLQGRLFIDLVNLTAGATPEIQGAFGGQFALAGGSANINGNRSDANNFLLNGVPINDSMWGRMAVSPSVDAVEEIKVQSFLYSAESGGAGGGQINITMRSGQNTPFGNVFTFFRRDALDARNHFAEEKPSLSQNNYGVSLGGPIVRSKSFFFVNGERLTVTRGITQISSLPTEALRRGDFDGFAPVTDPVTSSPFPGNRIPDSRIDPVSRAVLALVDLPNRPGIANNFIGVENAHNRSVQFNGRFDHQWTQADLLSGHVNVSDIRSQQPETGAPLGFAPTITLKTTTLGAQWTRVIGSTSVNQFRFGYTRSATEVLTANRGLDFAAEVGIQGTSSAPQLRGVPRFGVTGFSTIGDTASTLNGEAGDYHFLNDFSRILGGHSLKTGVAVSRLRPSPFFVPGARGSFNYQGQYTGQAFGDFLLGLPTTASIGVGDPLMEGRAWRLATYLQDDWRVTSQLTLNLGIRYELNTPPVERTNRLSNLDLETGNIILACESGSPSPKAELARFPAFTFVCNDDVGLGRALTKPDRNNVAPRLGFAYTTDNRRVVLRGGYGIFYSYPPMAVRIGTPSFSVPFFSQTRSTNSLTAPVPTSTILTTPQVTAFQGQPFSTDYRAGRTQQWSANVQYQLDPSTSVEALYLGSKGHDLSAQWLPNQAVPGPGPQVDRRPFPLLSANMIHSGPLGRSSYNSMQLRLDKRLWRGLSVVAHYTLTRAMDTSSNLLSNAANPSVPQNSRDLDAEYARSSFEARHRFVSNGLFDMPFSSTRRWLNEVLGGWSLAWVLTLQSSTPLSPVVPTDRSGTGGFQDRPHQVGDPNDLSNRTTDRFFNTAAFELQAAGTFGNAPRNSIDGPDYRNLDLALLKDVTITGRHRLQLRLEAFNALNRTNFNLPNRVFGTPQFGTVTSAKDARILQVGAKYSF